MAYWLSVHETIVRDHIASNKKRMEKIQKADEKLERTDWGVRRNLVIAACRELKIKLDEDEITDVAIALSRI